MLAIAGALSLGVAAQACGGDKTPAKSPSSGGDGGASGSTDTGDTGDHGGSSANPEARSDLEGDAKAAYDKAYAAFRAGDLQAAKTGFREASEKAPKAGAPHYSLGCVLERLGDIGGAQGEYRQAFSVQPNFVTAVGALAFLLVRTGHPSEADTLINDARSANPDNVQLITFAAEVKSMAGDSNGSAAAQKLAQEALSKDQKYIPAMIVIARDYFRQRRFDVAKAAIQAVLDGSDDKTTPARDPNNPEALLLRALISRELGDRKTALENFQLALKQRPDLFEAYVNVGEMKLEAGNASEALQPLEMAIKFSPNNAIAHMDLGDCYRLLGRAADAKREFDTAMQQDSSLAAVHYNLALLYLYSTNVPGVADQDSSISMSIAEIQKFQQMRGKLPRGQNDDSDELLATAKRKQSEIQVKKQAAAQAAAADAAATD
jgi:Flp pilus assembly protein TadD